MQNPEIQFKMKKPDYSGLKVEEITYGSVLNFYGKQQEYKLDYITAENADLSKPLPCVIFIHGGGFVQPCDKRQGYIPVFAKALCDAGYVVISPDYPIYDSSEDRNNSGHQRDYFGQKAAEAIEVVYAFLSENAERFHIDLDCMAIMGGSAGGMTAFAAIPKLTGCFHAFVNCWGVPVPEYLPDLSLFPPTLSIHGTADQAVAYSNEQPLQEALERYDIDHKLITLEDCPHTPMMKFDVFGPQVVDWLNRYVKWEYPVLTEEERNEKIKEARKLIRWDTDYDFLSDQQLRRKQPPLVKAPMTDLKEKPAIELPRDFSDLPMKNDLVSIFRERASRRVYSGEMISLKALSFLLWSTQGIKAIRGKRYATLRTVPSAGARHPFETYFLALHVEGLETGLYHYLPMTHSIELLKTVDLEKQGMMRFVSDTLCGQRFVEKASVIFYYSIIPYRGEWRYGPGSHRVMLMDIGHVSENMYLAATALGLGACGIGALDCRLSDRWIGLDGREEYSFYGIPVGTISQKDLEKEGEFYAFLKEEEQYYE